MLIQPAGGRKYFTRVCQILKHGCLWYRKNKQTNKRISHWQNVLMVMVPIFINKDMFESNYKAKHPQDTY